MNNSAIANLKAELYSITKATEIGFDSTPTAKQEIEALATRIEALNPTSEPTNHMELVQGRWRLLYSTFGLERETNLQRLSFGKLTNLPISVTGIFQEIYIEDQQYNNLIEFTTGSSFQGVTVVAGRYTIVDSKRLNIDFLKTYVQSVSEDLNDSALRTALRVDQESPLESTLAGSGWVDITYLDQDFRLVRGNQQNLYVLTRED